MSQNKSGAFSHVQPAARRRFISTSEKISENVCWILLIKRFSSKYYLHIFLHILSFTSVILENVSVFESNLKWINYMNRWYVMEYTNLQCTYVLIFRDLFYFIDPELGRVNCLPFAVLWPVSPTWDILCYTHKFGSTWLDSDALDPLHSKPHASHHFCVSMAM